MESNLKYPAFLYPVILILAVLAHLTGLLNDVFISDSALYAGIAKEMAQNNNYADLTFLGTDWLDKPHFQFWVTAFSYKVFGINAFAYKFPAILFTFLALIYTYKLAKELYNSETALLAVLILATAEHLVLSNNDVRAEPYLTGLIIGSIYYYHRLIPAFRPGALVLASLFAGLAVMTKGLFSLIPIVGAAGGELLIKRNWKTILSWRWVFSLMLIILFISPELITLYLQFDSHPEKIVFGRTGVSGIRFFLWDSQFGRFFNTGPIQGSGDPFFFLHTLLWAFLPWGLLMYYALYRRIRENIPGIKMDREFYTVSGILFSLLLFSFSRFQLPHYTNVIFPLLAILTAGIIQGELKRGEIRFLSISQWSHIFLIMGFVIFLQFLVRPEQVSILAIIGFLLTAAGIITVRRYAAGMKARILYYSCLGSILLNFYLNLVFYPVLLEYQSGTKAASFANLNHPGEEIRTLGTLPFTLSFHCDAVVRKYNTVQNLAGHTGDSDTGNGDFLLFTRREYFDSLLVNGLEYQVLQEFEHYHTTLVTGKFLNHKTRKDALVKQYLLKVRTNRSNPLPEQ
jgi:4-amino-4-deoxy-L-arabinose transferase-like glycosyltransferase